MTLENCVFENNYRARAAGYWLVYQVSGGITKFKNCTFQGTSGTITSTAHDTYFQATTGSTHSTWEVGDIVQNNTGAGDDWTGTIYYITSTKIFKIALTSGTYTTVDNADGIHNVTKSQTDSSLTKADMVEATCSASHGLLDNMYVTITDTTDYNGNEEITVTSDTTFAFVDTYVSDQSGSWYTIVTYGVMSYYRAAVLYEGTTTKTQVSSPYYHSTGGTHYDCKTLTLTVKDGGGTGIQDAIVKVRETDGKHQDVFITNSSGEVKDMLGDDPVFPWREITNNTGTSFNNWSTYDITISKAGYITDSTTGVDMTSDQTFVKTLGVNPAGTTTIHDSTIYGSTIY